MTRRGRRCDIDVRVSAYDSTITRRVQQALAHIGLSVEFDAPARLIGLGGVPGCVYYLGSRVASEMHDLPPLSIVIPYGATLSDRALLVFAEKMPTVLSGDKINPRSALRAIVSTTLGSNVLKVEEALRWAGPLGEVPESLLRAFLANPPGFRRRSDLRLIFPNKSRRGQQHFVRSLGFQRGEHLFTTMRFLTKSALVDAGLRREVVDEYLGITDGASFRRACRRARVVNG
jgi:hypothetical protein